MNVRQTSNEDRSLVERLLAGAPHSHVHLDWLDPTQLIGKEPFVLAEANDDPAGLLGCPPDPPGVAWIRAFAVADGSDLLETWSILWDGASHQLRSMEVERVAALALEDWIEPPLLRSGFVRTNSVIFYELELEFDKVAGDDSKHQLRSIRITDSDAIVELDHLAFGPIWQLSAEALSVALIQSNSASLIEDRGQVLGYQITTSSPFGAHLARLAVQPSSQRKGIGTALVKNAIESVREIGLGTLSVNTQEDNTPSRRLYEILGFQTTGREFPVFEFEL